MLLPVRSVGQATHALVSQKVGDGAPASEARSARASRREARSTIVIWLLARNRIGPASSSDLPRPAQSEAVRASDGALRLSRSPRDLLYRRELSSWARQPDTQVLVTVDYGGLSWRGHVGVVTTLFKYARLQPARNDRDGLRPRDHDALCHSRTGDPRAQARGHLSLYGTQHVKCAIGFCGHCQYGPYFICRDGPVFPYENIRTLFGKV